MAGGTGAGPNPTAGKGRACRLHCNGRFGRSRGGKWQVRAGGLPTSCCLPRRQFPRTRFRFPFLRTLCTDTPVSFLPMSAATILVVLLL